MARLYRMYGSYDAMAVVFKRINQLASFKYLGSVTTDEGSKPEILSRIAQTIAALIFSRTAQTTAALTRLKPVWNDRSICLGSRIQLMRSLVTAIFLYASESWTLTAELHRKATEMRCNRKILHI